MAFLFGGQNAGWMSSTLHYNALAEGAAPRMAAAGTVQTPRFKRRPMRYVNLRKVTKNRFEDRYSHASFTKCSLPTGSYPSYAPGSRPLSIKLKTLGNRTSDAVGIGVYASIQSVLNSYAYS